MKLTIQYIPISEIKPYKRNAKLHPQEQIDQIVRSIREFGFNDPVALWHGTIVEGHGRYLAAQQMELSEIPVIRLDDLTDEQRRAYGLAHNKLTMNSGFDLGLLEQELNDISMDMSQFGFDLGVAEGEAFDDEYEPEPPEEPKAKRGDIYLLGDHRLMCGDATSIDDVQKLCDGALVDMLLTDPPYNVDYTGKTKDALKIENDKLEDARFRAFLTDSFIAAKCVMKNGAAFHIWHADSEGYNFRGACVDAGLKIRQCLIWEKDQFVLGRQDFQWMHEPCLYGENPLPEGETEEYEDEYTNQVALYGWKDGGRHYWFKNRRQTTILKFDRPKASRLHPTMKPIPLFAYQIQCNTKPGESVLDLFGGSGTTVIACEQIGRRAYTMELDPRYVDVIVDRWQTFTGKKAKLLKV